MPALMMLRYWKPIAIAIALAGVFAYRAVLVHQRDAARAEVVSMIAQVADLKSAEAACEDAVARQNLAVDALKTAADSAATAAATRQANVVAAAVASASDETRRAAAIEQAPIAADCAGAIKWGNAQAMELSQW
jgi:hypothetical protein